MDLTLLRALNGLAQASPLVAQLGVTLSSLAFGLLTALLFSVALAWRWRPPWVPPLALSGAVLISDTFNHSVLKAWIARPRPCHVLSDLFTPAGCGTGWSMPSNHTANAFAAAAVIAVLWPRLAAVAYPVAALIALSRCLLGVHYPSDLIAGAALGTCIGLACAMPLRGRLRLRSPTLNR